MKEIQLTRGYVALVDDDDYEQLNKYKWLADEKSKNYIAVTRSNGKYKPLMSRTILDVTDPKILVDHIDRNPFNNQRSNLRLCNKSQNAVNASSRKNSSSKYIGVTWVKREKIWVAQITKNYQCVYLGRFKKEEDAALAYNRKAVELHGEFANLNQIPLI